MSVLLSWHEKVCPACSQSESDTSVLTWAAAHRDGWSRQHRAGNGRPEDGLIAEQIQFYEIPETGCQVKRREANPRL